MNELSELDRIRHECLSMVKKRAAVSAAAAALPLPGIDVATDVSLLLELIPAITERFGLSQKNIEHLPPEQQALIYSMVKKLGNMMIGRVLTQELLLVVLRKVGARVGLVQVARLVPLLGQAAAMGLSYSAMVYLGRTHIEHCYQIARRLRGESSLEAHS